MSIYQKTYAGGRKSNTWRVRIRYGDRVYHLSAYESKRSSEELDRLIRRLVECRQSGAKPSPDDISALRQLDEKRRAKLAEWDIVDPSLSVVAADIGKLIDQYLAAKRAEGKSHRFKEQADRVRAVMDGANMHSWPDLCRPDAPERVREWLNGRKAAGSMGEQTEQHHISAAKQFCKWVRIHRWAQESPIESMKGRTKVRPSCERGVLSPDEYSRLIAAAMARDWRIALVYGLAGTLGCRASTLRELTRENVEESDGVLMVTHFANKNARPGYGFITDPVIEGLLRRRLAEVAPATPLVSFPNDAARMMRRDLKAAGVPYKDGAGRQRDFHSLRHYAGTQVARVTELKTAQNILGHQDIRTTMRYVHHAIAEDMLDAARKVPRVHLETDADESKLA